MKSSIGHLISRLRLLRAKSGIAIAMLIAVAGSANVYAQRYAASQSSSTTVGRDPILGLALAPGSIESPGNATAGFDNNYATLVSTGLVVSAINISGTATLTLGFASQVPANTQVYVKVKNPRIDGLSLDLGDLVNLLGLLSSDVVDVTTSAGTASSTFVRDGANNTYILVSSSQAFSELTISLNLGNSSGALAVALASITLEVDGAVVYDNLAAAGCDLIPYTYSSVDAAQSGIDVELTPPLTDPQKALDGIVNQADNFSLLQNGNINAVSTVSQTFYLGKAVPAGNQVVAVISRPPSLADVSVLNNITVQAYLGSTPVGGEQSIRSLLLSVDLLNAFSGNALTPVNYTPGGSFDRIVVTSRTVLGVSVLFTGLRIHEIGFRPPVSFTGGTVAAGRVGDTVSSDLFTAKSGNNVSFSIQCGAPSDYTYELFQVSAPGGRTSAGTLPGSVTLNPDGTFSGTPQSGQGGTYTFDVRATNQFGQSAVATFTIVIENSLPVKLIGFKASSEGQTALLSWSTSEETNSDRFEIERSQNGKNWSKIGSLASNGESNTTRYYSYVDASPLKGENLYRLKMVDQDDTFAYSGIQSLTFKGAGLVYPNPVSASESLTLNVGDWSKVKQVKVLNAAGKVVFESSNALYSGISARRLMAGAYVILVTNVDGSVNSQRFVRQ